MSAFDQETTKDSVSDPRIDTIIAEKYKIISRIAGGGMGAIYKAEHVLMQRTVAIKLLHRQSSPDDPNQEFLKRFEREARAASQIEHPNAVMIYDFGIDQGVAYLVMQYIEGASLKDLIHQRGALSLKETVEIFTQACAAVACAHSFSIVHRDLKPDNIMISQREDGSRQVQVLDFGMAKILDDGSGTNLNPTMTQAGMAIGTPRYMAPEQVLGVDIDGRSDLYSLGIVLYEMLSGDVPFRSDSYMHLMMQHVNATPMPIREFKPELRIPQTVEKVVMKAIAKNPAERQQSVLELAEALEDAVNNSNTTALTNFNIPAVKIKNKNPKALAAAIVSLTLFALLASYLSSDNQANDILLEPTNLQTSLNQPEAQTPEAPETAKVERAALKADYFAGEIEQTVGEKPLEVAYSQTTDNYFTPFIHDVHQLADRLLFKANIEETAAPDETLILAALYPIDGSQNTTDAEQDQPIIATKVNIPLERMLIPDLIQELKSEDRVRRETAARLLQTKGNAPVKPLINALKDSNIRLRYWAAFLLGQLEAEEAVNALSKALNDRVELVSKTAEQALETIDTRAAREALRNHRSR